MRLRCAAVLHRRRSHILGLEDVATPVCAARRVCVLLALHQCAGAVPPRAFIPVLLVVNPAEGLRHATPRSSFDVAPGLFDLRPSPCTLVL